ncbi:MAG TPA: DUF6580 family putative transport protein [Bryobacteraceae bacterium]|jgi:hypothetical protein|nr:DUF6580 family putative transport protein [Bryobacteraceae bacterium]
MDSTPKPWAAAITVTAGMARMVQHLNFAPVGALSLFAGARLRGWQAYALPIALMAITDPFVGGYSAATPFVYASFLISVWLGTKLRNTENPAWIGGVALLSSVQFFLVSNLPAWLFWNTYGPGWRGLLGSYTAALPFYRRTLESDLIYTAILFGAHAWLSRGVARSERVVPQPA